jgi:alpha-tubulin suppressor-like RCC1 family protein
LVNAGDRNGYTKIYSNGWAFAALKADGSITAWGNSKYGGTGAPSDNGYTKIHSTYVAFAALKADGSIPQALIDPSALRVAKAHPFE